MADSSRSNGKRPFSEDEDSEKGPRQKKVRFPKGKKVKQGNEAVAVEAQDFPTAPLDPRQAAKERAKRRSAMTTELFNNERGNDHDISAAEENYEDDENFIDEGIQIEPFNLNQERKEGYFDDAGNFVEYVDENNKEKDPWLDSAEVDPRYAEKAALAMKAAEDVRDLSSQDIGKMKRRITDLLEPGETVLLALKRLKGTSNRKEKMPADRKAMFDQLTEDAMKLMENGDYNVYHEKREVFQREAEGYERLAQARRYGTSLGVDGGNSDDSAFPGSVVAPFTSENAANNGSEAFDMFAEDENDSVPAVSTNSNYQQSLDVSNSGSAYDDPQNDYVYDESTGYYYSSSLGYYYDPSSGLYCYASSGQWYSYDAESGTYAEIPGTVPSTS